ncbi:MAG: hypothetical protein KC591_09700 [Gemmatimonadetes bacterium]|nr:hypothetical protein [Gemmatimonadota bacterium]
MKSSEVSPVSGFAVVVLSWLLLCGNAFAASRAYEWSISASSNDPSVNVADIPAGFPANLYLWLDCTTRDGAAVLLADFEDGGSLIYLGFTPVYFVTDPVPGAIPFPFCVPAPSMLGTILLINVGAGGTMTLGASSFDGTRTTIDCATPPQAWPHAIRGFATPGFTPDIVDECGGTVSVEETGWGGVKSLYR